MRNRRTQINAASLRKQMTDAEHRLWYHLRKRQLNGYKFRRQYPVGPFITDFACLDAGLIVEVDGGQHGDQQAKDEARTRFLEGRGFKVLRFWNNDVLQQTEVCLEAIASALEPPPRPSPASGGGR